MIRVSKQHQFTVFIVLGMLLGVVVGLLLQWLPLPQAWHAFITQDILKMAGMVFIRLITMMVVPIVLVSLICGIGNLHGTGKLGRIVGKSLILYMLTTIIAITLAMFFASIFHVGQGMALHAVLVDIDTSAFSLKNIVFDLIPKNPFASLANGKLLQIIVFALLLGLALTRCGESGKKVLHFFQLLNDVLMELINLIMKIAPIGVFCLIAALFASEGIGIIVNLAGYFIVVLAVLFLHMFGTYSLFLRVLGGLSPKYFFQKMYDILLFAFSISSSNATIPFVLKSVIERLGVHRTIASFVIPVGATINMDGTAIMQGVATVFIANAYGLPLTSGNYIIVIVMATLASIGTAGVPGVGLITLSMVLQQVGLPAEGIGLIIGIDRLLDMARTSVNVAGDATISCLVAKSENALDQAVYNASQ